MDYFGHRYCHEDDLEQQGHSRQAIGLRNPRLNRTGYLTEKNVNFRFFSGKMLVGKIWLAAEPPGPLHQDLVEHGESMKQEWRAGDMPALAAKTAIVTGANRGIGFEMARALSRRGATVILACRDGEKGEAAVRQILLENPAALVKRIPLDLASLASIRSFADEFTARHDRLDILINNGGVMRPPFGKTADGFELQFGINHLGHFALGGLLYNLILRTPRARVVTLSSWGHYFGAMDFENLNAEKKYDPGAAYAQSKLANLLFAYELQRRMEGSGVEAISAAAHPGWTSTDLAAHWGMVRALNRFIGQKPEMGALPALYAAAAEGAEGGGYYGPGSWGGMRGYPTKTKSSARSSDRDVAARLWAVSEELTGVRYP
jgi:NAD(P)-dependent dehydrogenase (short-subunit alcohol dehydrogenase family)